MPHPKSARPVLIPAAVLVALALPSVAAAKGPSNEETVAEAKSSPLFRRQLGRGQLKKAGLQKIKLSSGVQMDFQQYVVDTALDTRTDLAPLFDVKLQGNLLTAAPTYKEAIYELEDRLVVDRVLTIPLAPDACGKPSLPKAVDELCFHKHPGKISKPLAKELADMRAKLASAEDSKIVLGNVTVAQAKKMSDEKLLDFLLNTDARTIHQVTIVPTQPVKVGGKSDVLLDLKAEIQPAVVDSGLAAEPKVIKPKGIGDAVFTPDKTFATKYFLTGFTYGREIRDSWEYTFAKATFFTDRYYVRLHYHVGAGFGVRAPFSIDVKSSGSSNSRTVELAVAPVDVDSNGSPAYPAVNLPVSKYFGGNEFVLEVKASCGLYVSIPGPNIDKSCPTLDKSFSRDIDPVIGTDTSKIHDWWLNGSTTGLKITYAVASASLDLGLGADVTNGRIGMRATPLSSTFSGVGAGNWSFSSKNPISFTVNRSGTAANAGFRLDDPRYGFDIKVTPKLRATVKVDVGIYDKSWILGPWALDFLSISKSFTLTHHDGTVAKHEFELFHAQGMDMALDQPATTTTSPTPTKPVSKPGAATTGATLDGGKTVVQ